MLVTKRLKNVKNGEIKPENGNKCIAGYQKGNITEEIRLNVENNIFNII